MTDSKKLPCGQWMQRMYIGPPVTYTAKYGGELHYIPCDICGRSMLVVEHYRERDCFGNEECNLIHGVEPYHTGWSLGGGGPNGFVCQPCGNLFGIFDRFAVIKDAYDGVMDSFR